MSEPAVTYNWGLSRIATAIRVNTSTGWQYLQLPNNLIITARNDQEIVDGLEQHNSGYIFKPQRFTFSLDVPVNTDSYKFLRELLLRRLTFDLKVEEDKTDAQKTYDGTVGQEYAGLSEWLEVCVFDDMSEPFRVGQLPVATYTGKALRFHTANNAADPLTPNFIYGDGGYPLSIPQPGVDE